MAEQMGERGIILFVEDRIDDFEIAVDVLQMKGETRRVERQATLKGAIDRVNEGGVDLVVLDLSLPDVETSSPLDTLNIFEQQCPNTKILVYSGSSWIASEIEQRQHRFVNKDSPQCLVQAVGEELRRQSSSAHILEYRLNALERSLGEMLSSTRSELHSLEASIDRLRDELHDLKVEYARTSTGASSGYREMSVQVQRLRSEWELTKEEMDSLPVLIPLGKAFYRLGLDEGERNRYVASLARLTPFLVYAQKKPLAMAALVVLGFLVSTTVALFLGTGKVEVFKWMLDLILHAVGLLALLTW